MIKIAATADVRSIVKQIADIKDKQLPFAMSLAINRTAQKVKAAEQHEIRDVFDRPTPYIQNSVFIKPSNKSNLTAKVWLKDQAVKGVGADKILAAEITGGPRRLKRYELALRAVGALPNGYYTVPGEAAKIDAYGNMSVGQIKQILSFFQANREAGFTSNSTDQTRAKLAKSTAKKYGISYVVMQPPGAPLGIWQRVFSNFGTAIRPVLMFVPTTNYEPIFDFKFVAENTIKKEFNGEFVKAWAFANATAKRN